MSEILAMVGSVGVPVTVVMGVLGYLAKQAHTDIRKRLDAVERALETHIAEDTDALRDIAIKQATVVERLEHVRELMQNRRETR